MAADEGLVEGEAFATLRQRRLLEADVKILADVLVKHASPLGDPDIKLAAQETINRGLADGLIVSGPATGRPTDVQDLVLVRQAVPEGLVLIGSGLEPDMAAPLMAVADGAIVGTWLKQDGLIANPIDPDRVRQMAAAIKEFA